MFSLPNNCHRSFTRILNCIPQSVIFRNKCSLNRNMVLKEAEGCLKKHEKIKCIQIVYKSTRPPPPGLSPFEPQTMPYLRRKSKPGGGYFLLIIPIITFGLGTWQVKRLKWKTELIQTVSERMNMEPIPLPSTDPEEIYPLEFSKVIVKGTFDHENEIYLGPKPCYVNGERYKDVVDKSGSGRESYGYNLITPLVLSDSGERIIVNRGWIRTALLNPIKRSWSKTEGEQTITGFVRRPEAVSRFAPSTHMEYKVWHYRDINDMADNLDCLPIYIDATAEHSIPECLWAGQTMVNLRNEHLSYSLTWYALSAATCWMWYGRYMKK